MASTNKPSKHEITADLNYRWATADEEEANTILEYKKMMEGEDEQERERDMGRCNRV